MEAKSKQPKTLHKKLARTSYRIIIAICSVIMLLIIAFLIIANTIIIYNDCDSSCRWDAAEDDEPIACIALCEPSYQTLWEKITGQRPHFN